MSCFSYARTYLDWRFYLILLNIIANSFYDQFEHGTYTPSFFNKLDKLT